MVFFPSLTGLDGDLICRGQLNVIVNDIHRSEECSCAF